MALRRGRKDDLPGPLTVAGRLVGFICLAAPAMAIIAAVVLLPAYTRLEQAKYERAQLSAAVAEAEALVEANERLIAAMADDPVLTARIAISQGQMAPAGEVVVLDPDMPPAPQPGAIACSKNPRKRSTGETPRQRRPKA